MTNDDDKSTTFLDLDISINNKLFDTKLYDKRCDFKFKVVSLSNLRPNIPKKQVYGIFKGELFRICKSSCNCRVFMNDVKLLISKLINQKFEREKLYNTIRSCIQCKPACLLRHWHNYNVNEFMQSSE